MTNPQAAVSRILTALSAVIEKPVSLVDAQSPEAGQFSIRLSVPRLAVVSTDGKPFNEPERRLVQDIFDVIRMAEESDARFEELEQRMLTLQRENLDLVVKNRTLNEVSTRDTLTGLYNRWYVIDKIDSEINRSLRHGSPMSVIMLDLDDQLGIRKTDAIALGGTVVAGVIGARQQVRHRPTP